jgi:hypothetical protein
MSKVINLFDAKRDKINDQIDEIKASDYNSIQYGHIKDLAECLEDSDLTTAQKICSRHIVEMSLIINPIGRDENYSVIVNLNPLAAVIDPETIDLFMSYGNSPAMCMMEMAKELNMYYTYIINRE